MSLFRIARNTVDAVRASSEPEAESFGRFYDNYSASVFGILIRAVNDERRAEEMLKDVFMGAWQNRRNHSQENTFSFIHLQQLARQAIMNYHRSTSDGEKIRISIDSVNVDSTYATRGEEAGEPAIVLAELAETTALDMVYSQGFTTDQAAERLGLTTLEMARRIRNELQHYRETIG